MKKTLLIFLAGTLISCGALTIQTTQISVEPFTKEIQIPESTKSELFISANIWMIQTFLDARSVIQFSDKEEGIIIGRYFLHETFGDIVFYGTNSHHEPKPVFAIIQIQVKNGTSKITITPDDYSISPQRGAKKYQVSEEELTNAVLALINDFQKHITKKQEAF